MTDASINTPLDSYAIVGGEEGKGRLNLLAEIMWPTTLRIFDDAGFRGGEQCLDVGCGAGHVTLELARIVGPAGRVVGIDFDPEVLELARRDAVDAGIENVEFLAADAQSVDGGPFDVVYARFLLSHVSEPEQVVAHMQKLLRPGGTIIVEDIDISGGFCHPPDPAYDRFLELYAEAVRQGGGEPDLGRRLPAIMLCTGLCDVRWNVFQPAHASGPHKQIVSATMEKIAPAVLRHGLATEKEIDDVLAGMRAFAEDPTTLVAMPRLVQVSGQV